jgi:hypothetical protein
MTSIFNSASFPSIATIDRPTIGGVLQPSGVAAGDITQDQLPNGTDSVVLTLSDGTSPIIFDSKWTALRCLKLMVERGQWLLQASDDVMIVSVSHTKLLVAEATLINQKLFSSFLPVYLSGETRFCHRNMSQTLTLADALQSVGFCLQGQGIQDNIDLTQMTGNPHMIIVDWNYRSSPARPNGSQLDDAQSIQY